VGRLAYMNIYIYVCVCVFSVYMGLQKKANQYRTQQRMVVTVQHLPVMSVCSGLFPLYASQRWMTNVVSTEIRGPYQMCASPDHSAMRVLLLAAKKKKSR